jgi:hypothetical protein
MDSVTRPAHADRRRPAGLRAGAVGARVAAGSPAGDLRPRGERTAFGCSDDRDLTYFSEAFFRDALPAAADLEAMFDPGLLERERALDRGPAAPALIALR